MVVGNIVLFLRIGCSTKKIAIDHQILRCHRQSLTDSFPIRGTAESRRAGPAIRQGLPLPPLSRLAGIFA